MLHPVSVAEYIIAVKPELSLLIFAPDRQIPTFLKKKYALLGRRRVSFTLIMIFSQPGENDKERS